MRDASCTMHHAFRSHTECTTQNASYNMHTASCTMLHAQRAHHEPSPCTLHHAPCDMHRHHAPGTMHLAPCSWKYLGQFALIGYKNHFEVNVKPGTTLAKYFTPHCKIVVINSLGNMNKVSCGFIHQVLIKMQRPPCTMRHARTKHHAP